MFTELLKAAEDELKRSSDSVPYEDVIEFALDKLYDTVASHETENITRLNGEEEVFAKRNYARWEEGFKKLQMLRSASLEAGIKFQEQFLQYPEYVTDPLLGVLMRLHANACRITGEIIWLLKGGYSDGALARWRTLFEISLNSLIIRQHGHNAAIDYIKHGKIKSVEGMQEYQKTAGKMNVEPYPEDELEAAIQLKKELSGDNDDYQWARKYVGSKKTDKLREHVGLGHWSHNYKLASKHVHADYSEMLSLFAMSEAKKDGLLVGPSNSGLVEPAHMTAISLGQITGAFLTAHIEDSNLDYTDSIMYLKLIQKYVDAVGQEFMRCYKNATSE